MNSTTRAITETVNSIVADTGPTNTVDDMLGLWAQLGELGMQDVLVAPELGGGGGTLLDLAVVVNALAEQGVSVPIIETGIGRWAMSASGLSADGVVSVGHICADGDLEDDRTTAEPVLSAPWGRLATQVLVCHGEAVHLASPKVVLETAYNVAGEPVDRLQVGLDGSDQLLSVRSEDVLARISLLRTASLLGASRGALDLTRRYVGERHQFGGPLADIPAVAANLATMRVQLEQAETALRRGIHALDRPGDQIEVGPGAAAAASVARILADAAATDIAQLAHRLHGAIGTTLEYPLHHLTRRIWAWRDADGNTHEIASTLGRTALEMGEAEVWATVTAWLPTQEGQSA